MMYDAIHPADTRNEMIKKSDSWQRYLIRVRRDNFSRPVLRRMEIDSVSWGTSCSYSLKYSAEKRGRSGRKGTERAANWRRVETAMQPIVRKCHRNEWKPTNCQCVSSQSDCASERKTTGINKKGRSRPTAINWLNEWPISAATG